MAELHSKVTMEASLDASGMTSGAKQGEAALNSLSATASQASAKVDAASDKMGNGLGAASKKTEAATRSMVNSIQRATAEMEAGGRASVKYYETLASQRGVDVNVLRPYLDQLDKVSASHVRTGLSAKEMSFAMRGLPAQFTDIAVSMASGQQPLTVLLQQGGQLKDMFGGIGPAAKAMGEYVVGLVNPYTLAAAAVAALGYAYYKGSEEQDAYVKSLVSTNHAIGLTADQLADMAKRMDAVSGTTAFAAENLATFVAAGVTNTAGLERYATVAGDAYTYLGKSVEDTAKAFSALEKDPLNAAVKLDEAERFLTASVYDQIKALEEQGKKTEAAKVAQDALADATEIKAKEMEGSLGIVERAWERIKNVVKETGSAIMDIGRQQTIAEQIIAKRIELAKLSSGPQGGRFGLPSPGYDEKAKQLQLEIDALKSDAARLVTDGQRDAERESRRKQDIAIRQANDAWIKANKTKQQQRDTELKQLQDFLDAKLISETEYQRRAAIINDKYAEKTSKAKKPSKASLYGSGEDREAAALRARIDSERELTAALSDETRANDRLTEGQKLALKYREQAKVAIAGSAKAHLSAMAASADELGAQQSLNAALKDKSSVEQSLSNAAKQRAHDLELENEETRKQLEFAKLSGEQRAIAQAEWEVEKRTKQELYDLSKRLEDAILAQTAAEANLATLRKSGGKDAITAAEQALKARQKIIENLQKEQDAIASNGQVERQNAATRAASQYAVSEWQRTSQQIESALTDALMKGFESGKSFVKSLRDSIVNTFKTLVVRIAMQPVMGAVNGIGMAMMGNTAQAGSLNGQPTSFSGGISNVTSFFGGNSFGQGLANMPVLGGELGVFGGAGQYANWQYGAAGALGGIGGNFIGKGLFGQEGAQGGSMGGSLGASIGMGIGGPLGAVVGGLLGSVAGGGLGKLLGGGGETRSGASYRVDADGAVKKFQGPSGGEIAGDAVRKLMGDTGDGINKMFEQLGSSARLEGFTSGLQTSKKGKAFVFSGGRIDGKWVGEDRDPRVENGQKINGVEKKGSMTAEEALKAYELELKQFTIQALQSASDLPQIIKGKLEGIDAESISADAANSLLTDINTIVTAVNGFREAVKTLPDAFNSVKNLSFDAAASLIEFAGGIDNLAQQMSGYYDGYYSEAEKLDTLSRQVSDALSGVGIAMPKTRAEFRELVESLDLNTEAGRKAYATMMQTAGAFGQVADAAAQAAEVSLAAVYAERLAIADEYAGLLDAAVQRVRDAYAREISAKQALVQRLAGYVDSLKRLRDQLKVGDLSTGGPEDRYREAEKLWKDTLAKAQGGDIEAQGALASIGEQFLQISREYNASNTQYASDWQAVYDQLGKQEEAARNQLSHEQRQLGTLQSQLDELVGANETLLTIAEALAALAELKANNPMQKPDAPVGPGGNGSIGDYGGYIDPTKLSEKEKAINRLYQELLGRDADVAGLKYWLETGLSLDAIRWNIEQDKKVNGSHRGGLDYVPFDGYVAELHKGERVLTAAETRAMDFSRYGRSDSAPLVAEIRALREEVATLRAERRQADASHQSQRAGLAQQQTEQVRQQSRVLQRLQADSL